MMRKDLLDEINSLADSLANVSIWKNSKDAFGHIIEEKDGVEKVAQKDYIYEFYCYMKIIEDLSKKTNHTIQFIPGNLVFPKSPSNKTARPYFILVVNGNAMFQICSGTKIQSKVPNIKKAPDISFQSIESDDDLPSHNDVYAIYDAKYSDSGAAKSFQEGQMALFSRMIRLLEQNGTTPIHGYYNHFTNFEGNCLITNKQSYTDDLEELAEEGITVVELFDKGKTFLVI